jgi:putative RNA 2'-phosphotransferase
VLRHQPETIGLQLDQAGWADLDILDNCAVQAGHALDRETILAVVETNAKRRFALSADGSRIRALPGHSTCRVCIDHTERTAPSRLYHGTATWFLDCIW